MKKILLLSFLFIFTSSQNITATPVDFIKPINPTEESVHTKKKKKKFFARMTERIMKKRKGRLIKKLGLESKDCDRIIKTDGEELDVVIIEIGSERIRYKNCDFQNGPTRTIRKEDIFMIKYADGTKEVMTDIEALKENKKEIVKASNQNNEDNKRYWKLGFLVGILLGVLGLLVIVLALNGDRRKEAIRGTLGGILARILIIVTFGLLLSSYL